MSGRDRDRPSDEFANALGDVKPLAGRSRHVQVRPRPASGPKKETRRDPFLHPDPDEPRLAHREGVTPKRFDRLRSGALAPQRRLDLHRLRADPAQQMLARTIEACSRAGETSLLVVHGRGKHKGGVAVLREALPEWLEANDSVIAYAPAPGPDGGAGGTLVLLRSR